MGNVIIFPPVATVNSGNSNQSILEVLSSTGDNVITLPTPFVDALWGFAGVPVCVDSAGTRVEPTITNVTASSFTVNIGDTGTINYLAIHK